MRRAIIVSTLILLTAAGSAAQADTATGLFTFRTIVPGTTMTLAMEQTSGFPLGCPQLLLLCAGAGSLTINLNKTDVAGDGIFMLGLVSGGHPASLFRAGVSKGVITKTVMIGPGAGFVWLYSGVIYSTITAPYAYTIQLTFQPTT